MLRAARGGLLLLTTACSGSTASVGSPPAYDIGGAWTGTFVSQTGVRGISTASLTQSGGSVAGSFSVQGSCIGGGKFSGTLSADALSGSITSGAVTVSVYGTVANAKQIDGTYSLQAAGACPTDDGSFHLSR
jgi:hypothetical protein